MRVAAGKVSGARLTTALAAGMPLESVTSTVTEAAFADVLAIVPATARTDKALPSMAFRLREIG